MPRRALHWLVLGFTTLWFGVLVPVHNRGEIGVPGGDGHCASHPQATPTPPCHASTAEPRNKGDLPDSAPRQRRTCAVCYFIAGLDAPPPVTVIVTRLGFAGTSELPAPQELPTAKVTLPFHSRAPPIG